MLKSAIALLTLILCSSVLADPLVFSCERPAWKNTKSCAVNDTYESFVFYVDSEEFASDQLANKKSFRYEKPENFYTIFKACGSGKSYTYNGKFAAYEGTVTFWTPSEQKKIEINLDDMTATLRPAKYGNTLNCEKVEGVTVDEYVLLEDDAGNAVSIRPPITAFW